MYSLKLLVSIIVALPSAHGLAFGEAFPTDYSKDAKKIQHGRAPQPTKGPSIADLRRRQTYIGPETCGWVDRDLCKTSSYFPHAVTPS